MKNPLLFILTAIFYFLVVHLQAQTLHNVTVSNFEFNPETLTIQAGDTVRWSNISGTHSVQGDLATYPENPEGFGNEIASGDWNYDFKFELDGAYDYRCGLHTTTMFGHIVVEGTVGISEPEAGPAFVLFPNPINNFLRWKWNDNEKPNHAFLTLFDSKGTLVKQVNLLNTTETDMSNLSEGLYMYRVDMKEEGSQTGKFLISR